MRVFQGLVLSFTLLGYACAQTSASGSATTNTATQATTPATNASSQTNSAASAAGQTGTIVPVELSKSIDSKKAKIGDEVTARVVSDVRSGGAIAIPRGSKLVGKITEANARAKGDATSSLGVVFDRAVLKNGSTINLVSTIQAVLAPPEVPVSSSMTPSGGDDMGAGGAAPRGGSSEAGGLGSTAGAIGNTAGSAVGAVGNTVGGVANRAPIDVGGNVGVNAPAVTSQTTGVVGLKGLELNSSADSSASGSVLTGNSKSVKLDSGTRFLVNVSSASPGAPADSKK
jgi:hypothetical protein